MKRNYYLLLYILSTLFLISCEKENLDKMNENSSETMMEKINLKDGRIYFPNIQTFQTYYSNLKKIDNDKIAELLEDKYYSNGFYSLKPILNKNNEEIQLNRHIDEFKSILIEQNLTSKTSENEFYDNFDELEDIFGEELFSSILNQNAEVHVANKIYKYTDVGLFISDANKISELDKYLEKKQISRNLLVRTDESVRIAYMEENNPDGGITNVDEFQYYYEEVIDDEIGGGGGGSTTPTNQSTPNYELALIANNLETCSGEKPWFANLWGEVKVCYDEYESDNRRVKVKYYDIDVLLIYQTGIKTKHQYKGWTGLWREEDTDEMAMGINSISWKFEIPTPPATILGYRPARYYLYNGKMFESLTGYYNAYYAGQVPMPNLPFQGSETVDLVVEIAVGFPFSPFDDEEDVRKFFYENIYDTAKNLLLIQGQRQMKKVGVVLATNELKWIQYYDFTSSCLNCSDVDKVFDFGIVTPKITYNFGTGDGGNWSISSWEFDFRYPSLVGLSSYGMAKRNGQWHGKRFIF